MVPPAGTRRFEVKGLPAGAANADAKVRFDTINDYGAIQSHEGATGSS